MKNALLLFTLFLCQISFGQSLNDMKYDSIVKIENTDLSLIYAKKKTAVWHDANFFVAQPTKNYFVFLEAAQLLVEVDFKAKSFYAIVQDENTGGYKRFFLANNGFEADIYIDYTTFIEGVQVDTSFYSSSFSEIKNFERGPKIGRVGLNFSKKYLSICDYKREYEIIDPYLSPLKSSIYPDEDSIGTFGEVIYPPNDTIFSIANSGVVYLKTKKMVLPRQYVELYHKENRIVTSEELGNIQQDYLIKGSYQLHQLDKTNIYTIKKGIKTNNPQFITHQPEFDSIVDLDDYYLSILYTKQGTSVVDGLTNSYYITPSKHLFFKLESLESIIEVDIESDSIHLIIIDENQNKIKRLYLGSNEVSINIGIEPEMGYNLLCYNGESYDNFFFKLNSDCHLANHQTDGFISAKIEDNLLYLNDYTRSYEDFYNYPIQSEMYPGEDSIDYDGNTVYYPADVYPGTQNSGVYDLELKKWILPQAFSKVENNGNYILVSKELDGNNISVDSVAFYQLFELKDGETTLVKDNIITNNIEVVSLMTNYDSIKQTSDNSYYTTYKNGKQGLVEYQLFNEYEYSYLELRNEVIEKPEFNFIYYSNSGVYISKNEKFYQIQTLSDGIVMDSLMNGGGFGEAKDEPIIYINKKDGTLSEIDHHSTILYEVGISQINDSLIRINDIIGEYQAYYPLVGEYGDDSIDVEGEVVYPPAEPGEYHCGIYNLNQNRWIIQPNEFDIQYLGGNHLVVEKPIFDERHIIQSEGYKSIYDFNGNELESSLTPMACITQIDPLKKLVLNENESIEKINVGGYANQNIPDSIITPPYFYKVKNETQEKIIRTDLDGTNPTAVSLTSFHDFVICDPQSKFDFYIDDGRSTINFSISKDSLGFYIPESLDINAETYNLDIYTVLDYGPILSALAVLSIDGDTTLMEFGMKTDKEITDTLADYKSRTKRIISIHKNENELIYNISNTKGSYHIYGEDYYEYGESAEDYSYDWELEYASIYRKTNVKWTKVSPNYNTITKIPFGYICKTAGYSYVHSENFGYEVLEQKTISSSYILLDSTLKPIGYSDFYNFDLIEDLGFGLKICAVIDKDKWNTAEQHGNCFLVDYSGKPICNAEYDNFELVEGKIYGVRDEIYKMDEEWGEIIYDNETGDPIYLQEAAREYIIDYSK